MAVHVVGRRIGDPGGDTRPVGHARDRSEFLEERDDPRNVDLIIRVHQRIRET